MPSWLWYILVEVCVCIAGTKFVALCDGIYGNIGSLVEDDVFTNEPVDLTIDTLVIDMTREDTEGEERDAVMII